MTLAEYNGPTINRKFVDTFSNNQVSVLIGRVKISNVRRRRNGGPVTRQCFLASFVGDNSVGSLPRSLASSSKGSRGRSRSTPVVGSKELEEPEFFITKRSVEFGIFLGIFVQESSADLDSAAVPQLGTEECSEPSVTRGWDSIVSIGSASDEGSKSADVGRGAGEQDR